MKVSPMAAGSGGAPGVDLGNVNLGTTASPDKLAAAKALAAGQEPQREEIQRDELGRIQSVRKIVMKTNASPDRFEVEVPSEATPETPISTEIDTSGQTNAAVESTQPLSPQFAALAKERRALQVMKRELAEQKAQLSKPPEGDYIAKADLLANPLKIFEAGLTYDQLTEAILANQSGMSPELKALKDEIKALKEGVDSRFTTQEETQEMSALNQIADDIESLSKEGDDYELFRSRDGLKRALNKIYTHYKKTGQVLDNREVVVQIENELLDEAIKLADFKKVKSKLAPPPVQQPQLQGKQMKTLTSRDGSGVPLDRRARAIAAMRGQKI